MSEEVARRGRRELARLDREDDLALHDGHFEEREPYYPFDLEPRTWRFTVLGVAIALALVSFFLLGPWASSPEAHSGTITSLDEKKSTVTMLMGSSTASSAAITVLPGDLATPIAEKLVDLSSDFLIVLTAIYLEKYLLTTMGFIAFRVLVPAACVLIAASVCLYRRGPWNPLADFGFRLLVFAVAAYFVVPASTWISSMIERTYEASIAETLATAEQTVQDIEATAAEEAATESSSQGSQSWLETLQGVGQSITELPSTLTGKLESLTEEAQQALNNFIDALAVMIVTSCVIPILVLLCFLWLARAIFGIQIEAPTGVFRAMPRGKH